MLILHLITTVETRQRQQQQTLEEEKKIHTIIRNKEQRSTNEEKTTERTRFYGHIRYQFIAMTSSFMSFLTMKIAWIYVRCVCVCFFFSSSSFRSLLLLLFCQCFIYSCVSGLFAHRVCSIWTMMIAVVQILLWFCITAHIQQHITMYISLSWRIKQCF